MPNPKFKMKTIDTSYFPETKTFIAHLSYLYDKVIIHGKTRYVTFEFVNKVGNMVEYKAVDEPYILRAYNNRIDFNKAEKTAKVKRYRG